MMMPLARALFSVLEVPPCESDAAHFDLKLLFFELKSWEIALIHLELISLLFQLIFGQLDLSHDSIAFSSC